jgi:RNA recognition motif-containing protein
LYKGGSSRYSQNTAESTPQHSQQAEKTTKSSVIYLANLSYEVNEQDIMEYLADFKPVRAKLLMDGEGKSKGSGFVQLSSSSDAHRAITSLQNSMFQGRKLVVNEAHSQPTVKTYN